VSEEEREKMSPLIREEVGIKVVDEDE